jgi:hypothetical protein
LVEEKKIGEKKIGTVLICLDSSNVTLWENLPSFGHIFDVPD